MTGGMSTTNIIRNKYYFYYHKNMKAPNTLVLSPKTIEELKAECGEWKSLFIKYGSKITFMGMNITVIESNEPIIYVGREVE